MRKMKNKVLKALAYTNGFVLICAMCGADSDNIYIPLTLIAVTGTWLMLFAYANGYLSIKYKEVESNENHITGRRVRHSDGQRRRTGHARTRRADRPHLLQIGEQDHRVQREDLRTESHQERA